MTLEKWDARIRRANHLAAEFPFASEALKFYERLTQYQKSLYSEIEAAHGMSRLQKLGGIKWLGGQRARKNSRYKKYWFHLSVAK